MENHPQLIDENVTSPPVPDYDTPWKIAVEQHFQAFMAFYFPAAHAQIDWSFQHEFLDKELQAIAKDALVGTRHVDKLVKVRRISGEEDWLCIHIEVQVSRQAQFARRMFVYHYRIFDLYGKPAVSMALLGDDSPNWLPQQYGYAMMGCKLSFEFPVVKLLNYGEMAASLETDPNPFALLTLAYLKNRATATDMNRRYEVKCQLVRLLYARKWDATMIRQLFLVIDWMMALPPELTLKLSTFIGELEEEQRMEYVSSIERLKLEQKFHEGVNAGEQIGEQRGEQGGKTELLTRLLTRRFGNLPAALQALVKQATIAQIDAWFDRSMDAQTLDEVFQGLAH
jgi:Domain of unknown function (DUF4351)